MKNRVLTIAALALLVTAVSSCSVELRGYNRPWLGKVATNHPIQVKNS